MPGTRDVYRLDHRLCPRALHFPDQDVVESGTGILKNVPIIVGVHASAALFVEGHGIVALPGQRMELARGVVARVCGKTCRQLHATKKTEQGRGRVRLSHGRLHGWRPVPSRASGPKRLQIHFMKDSSITTSTSRKLRSQLHSGDMIE